MPMEVFEQYNLINRRKWTQLLQSLEPGKSHKFSLPSVEDIHSLKSTAYNINTDRGRRIYSIKANKRQIAVEITVNK